MTLHILYRTSGGENAKARPAFFSKLVALRSFASALDRVPETGEVRFLCDGPVPAERVAAMRSVGEIVELPNLGNSGSYRRALATMRESRWPDDDLVYFAEDDYLYRPEALEQIVAATAAIDAAAFFTPYDHPDYRSASTHLRFRRLHRSEHWDIGPTTWRSVRSTTMTFAARVGPMRRATAVHELGARGPHPRDFEIWSALQSTSPRFLVAGTLRDSDALGTRALLRTLPRRVARRELLIAAQPSLATHLEEPWLAPGVDWESVADRAAG